MLNASRTFVTMVLATIAVSVSALGWASPASAYRDLAKPGDDDTPSVGQPRYEHGRLGVPATQDGKPAAPVTPGRVYSGPTRKELAFQRCEEQGPTSTACKAGVVAGEIGRQNTPGSPAVAAREVVAALQLQPPRIGMTPRPGPDSVALVGYDVWLWVDSPDTQTFGPATATASIDAWTLTVNGHVESVDWDMGDGNVVHCTGPGTPYVVARDGLGPSPDCGHVYTEQGQYTVTVTAHWRVDWTTSDGTQSGTFTTDQVSTLPVTVGEWQVLLKRGKER